jgi:hypothetical protein
MRDIELGSSLFFWHPNHPLYIPTARLLWSGAKLFAPASRSPEVLLLVNAVATSACGVGLLLIVRKLTAAWTAAFCSAGVLAFSWATWHASVEVDPGPLALCGQLLTLAMLCELGTAPRRRTGALLGLGIAWAMLFHQPNGLLLLVALLALALCPLSWRGRFEQLASFGAVVTMILVVAVVAVGLKSYREFGEIVRWLFFFLSPQSFVSSGWGTFVDALASALVLRTSGPYWLALIVAFAAGLPAAARRWPAVVAPVASWVLACAAVTRWQAQHMEAWASALLPVAFLLGLCVSAIGAGGASRLGAERGKRLAVAACALPPLLAWHNGSDMGRFGDWRHRSDSETAAAISRNTHVSDIIVSADPQVELYLSYYENRQNFRRLDSSAREGRPDSVEKHARMIADDLHAGAALVMGRDALELTRGASGSIQRSATDPFWEPYRTAMHPAVVTGRDVQFWRIPSAREVLDAGGWTWTSFNWGWDVANVQTQSFPGAWCFEHRSRPMLFSPKLDVNAAAIQSVDIRMRTDSRSDTGELLFYGSVDGRNTQPRSVRWSLNGDTAVQTHRVFIPHAATPGEKIVGLRLSPVGLGDEKIVARTCVEALTVAVVE